MFCLHHAPDSSYQIRVDFAHFPTERLTSQHQRMLLRLGPSLTAVNAWLGSYAANADYAEGTVLEYAKVCRYALEWLFQSPVRLMTGIPIPQSLLALETPDIRALDAWLALPSHQTAARHRLCKTGQLPGPQTIVRVAPATRRFRRSVLRTFYEWVLTEYVPEVGEPSLRANPYTRSGRCHPQGTPYQGFLPPSHHTPVQPLSVFRSVAPCVTPDALSLKEVQWVLTAVSHISAGRNAANRNGAVIRLLLWGMLRASEVVTATWEMVDEQVLHILGKGRKQRSVPIADPATWAFLQAYTMELHIPLGQRFHGPLLRQLDHEDRPMTVHTLDHLMLRLKAYFRRQAHTAATPQQAREYTSLAERLHCHLFRATGATLFAAQGMDLLKLALLLGHSDPATTQRYYIAAQGLALPQAVQRIFHDVTHALATVVDPASSAAHE